MIALTSLTAGSWISLHRAPPAPITEPDTAREAAAPNPPPAPPPPTIPEGATPEITPWPHLNPEVNLMKAWRLAEGPHRERGDNKKLVTLTFDDGPFPETTPKVLDLLAQHGARATFFIVGRYLDGESARAIESRRVLTKIVASGHLVGNHTHDHANLSAVSHTQVLEQIDEGAASIERVIGKRPMLFRPPFGELDDFGQEAVRTRGLDIVLWSLEAKDMERDNVAQMTRDLIRYLNYNEGGIVLLHDIRSSSVEVLKRLFTYLDQHRYDPERPEREGYAVVDLPTYMRALEASPPQPNARNESARSPSIEPKKADARVSREKKRGRKDARDHRL